MSSPDLPAADPAATKVCPFCAETIKAAAVKCRYCQSDLTDTPAPVSAPEQTPFPAPEPAPFPSPEPAPDPAADRAPAGSRSRWFVVLAAVSVAATLVFLLLAFRAWRDTAGLDDASAAGRAVRAAVSERVEALLSYDYSTFDTDLEAAEKAMTPKFRAEYQPTVAEIRDRALAQKRTQQADVVAVSVVTESKDRVTTLVFVNTTSSAKGSASQRVMQNRVNVTMVRDDDGSWLIDDVSVPVS